MKKIIQLQIVFFKKGHILSYICLSKLKSGLFDFFLYDVIFKMAAKSSCNFTLANLSQNIVVWYMTYTVFAYAELIFVHINTFNGHFEGQNAISRSLEGHLTCSKAFATIVVWRMFFLLF